MIAAPPHAASRPGRSGSSTANITSLFPPRRAARSALEFSRHALSLASSPIDSYIIAASRRSSGVSEGVASRGFTPAMFRDLCERLQPISSLSTPPGYRDLRDERLAPTDRDRRLHDPQ